MAKNTSLDRDDLHQARPASAAGLDGWRRLALAGVLEAFEDYRARDVITALDALRFLIDPGPFGAACWLDALAQPGGGDPDKIFTRIVTNHGRKNKKPGRSPGG